MAPGVWASHALASRQQWTRRLIASVWRTPQPLLQEQLSLRGFSSVWLDVADDIGRPSDDSGRSSDQHRTRVLPKAQRGPESAHGSAEAPVHSTLMEDANQQGFSGDSEERGGNGPLSLTNGGHQTVPQKEGFTLPGKGRTPKLPLQTVARPTQGRVSVRAVTTKLPETGLETAAPDLKAWAARRVLGDRARFEGRKENVGKARLQESQQGIAGESVPSGDKEAPAASRDPINHEGPPSAYFLSQLEDLLLGKRKRHDFTRAGYSIKFDRPLDSLPGCKGERATDNTVFAEEPKLIAAAQALNEFPPAHLPEIAFAGRSNVGKSSLINALSRRTHVTRVSDKPGETQSINFYGIGPRLSLVDLPGYGFAYAADEKRESWSQLVEEYLQTRKSLKRVMLLIDARLQLKASDLDVIDMLERNRVRYQIVLTKADMVSTKDLARRATAAQQEVDRRSSHVSPLVMVSSQTGAGVLKLRAALSGLAVRL
ncbi:GTP-binding protein [Klebsormidium nitens]|uniref:GTP-binding protein n=1 Tax=Klebsormidium nitens TaxID=105231 RepID=A0A1Y1HJV5_KLENI|nr:GTP-binding protein [Klebsormidium nitens]|eukprot:GAQ77852.1 GTP-binding protein [Klebsormidium nitens]